MKSMKKTIAALVAISMIFGCVIGGTIAWLMDSTTEVTNTFTTSDVDIELTENTGANYKMVPGGKVEKDPYVTVTSGSEDCYLFVKIDGENASISKNENGTYSLGNYVVYAVDEGWTVLEGQTNVFYKVIDEDTEKGEAIHRILGDGSYTDPMGDAADVTVSWNNDEVATKPSVTKAMMNALAADKYPKLTFTAYAVQMDNLKNGDSAVTNAAGAWEVINPN